MATRQSTSEALARRCAAVGWKVEDGNSGGIIKVTNFDGATVNIHRTYSDRNGFDAIERRLNNYLGLKRAERAMANADERQRLGKILKDREANDKALQAASRAAKAAQAAVQKATIDKVVAGAGYLTVETMPLEWFTTPQPRMLVKSVIITPAIAEYLLEHHNADNRKLRPHRYRHYRDIIVSGQWKQTHQGLAIDTKGQLQDGQHRLKGIVEAGELVPDLQLPMVVFLGVDPENFAALDTGMLRSAADVLNHGGHMPYAANTAAAIRMVIAIHTNNLTRTRQRHSVTNQEVSDFFRNPANDEERIRDSTKWAVANYRNVGATVSALSAAHYLLTRANGVDNIYLNAYFEGLATGCYAHSRLLLDNLDQRAVIRRRFERARKDNVRLSPFDNYVLLISAWNNIVNDHSPKTININDDTTLPAIDICDPASASPPRQLRQDIRFITEDQKEDAAA